MRTTMKCLTLVGALLLLGTVAAEAAFKVVVADANPVSTLSKDQLAKYFKKRVSRWDNGSEVKPVDQPGNTSVRREFSEGVLGLKVESVKSYWQKMIFSGRGTPPPELPSDSEILEYVRSNRYAIGYVTSGASVGDGVKVVEIGE